jgi:hypothetical protein
VSTRPAGTALPEAIIGGTGSERNLEARIKQLRAQIEETTSDYDREKLLRASIALQKFKLNCDYQFGVTSARALADEAGEAA